MTNQLFLTSTQTASLLGISNQTMVLWRKAKKGPKFFKNGKIVIYYTKDVEKFLSEQKNENA